MKGRVFDCKKHSNIKRHASYRRIGGGRYYKSIVKYKSEKRRRKQILKLRKQGHTLAQIASLLKVSRRTIHRDLQKLYPYTHAEQNRLRWENSDYSNLNMKDMIKLLKGYREVIRKARLRGKVETLIVRVDVEAAFRGCITGVVSFIPRLPVNIASWGEIVFELRVRGQFLEATRLYAVIPSNGQLILAANNSKDPTTNQPLELEVVDLKQPEQASDKAQLRQLAQIQHQIFHHQNPWCIQEFLDLKPEQQDQLLQQYIELYGRHNSLKEAKVLTIILNVDQALNSAYAACFKPRLPVALGDYSKIILKLQAATKTQHLTTLQNTDIEYGLAHIEKNQLYKKSNALKGLRIIP